MVDLIRRLEKLPKAELHVHLRGAIPLPVLRRLMAKYGSSTVTARAPERLRQFWSGRPHLMPFLTPSGWDDDDLHNLFAYDDFDDFLATYAFTGCFFQEPDDLRELIHGVLSDLRRQRIVYAEVTCSVREYLLQGLTLDEVVEGLETVTVPGLHHRWIVDCVRDFGPEAAVELVQQIAALGPEKVVGITIGGSEHRWPPERFAAAYREAEKVGWRKSVHAGEALGAQSVRNALDVLGAERIGHGIRAVEDPDLVQRLADEQIPLEISPTSNLYTGVVGFYHEHPLPQLHAAGVPLSVSTDDPTFFHTTLVEELIHVHDMGLDEAEILELVRNGFRQAFLEPTVKQAYLDDLERAIRKR